ncbi:MAG: hypothetical protein PHE50_05495 [Dehalococcoidales bacterium]|nr:hypothetical protein [Dehalococcoidales bacterium]
MAEQNEQGKDNPVENTAIETNMETRIKELERLVTEREAEINGLKNTNEELRGKLVASQEETVAVVKGYRVLLTSIHPEITPEMISGESIGALNESLGKAQSLMMKVKQTVLKELAQTRIPAGAPGRQPADITGLSPREKINYGIGGK